MSLAEFIGPPGGGKTTLSKKLVERDSRLHPGRRSLKKAVSRPTSPLSALGLPLDPIKIPWKVWKNFPSDLMRSIVFGWHISDSLAQKFRRGKIFFYELVKFRILSWHPNCWIIDQGWIQNLLSCRANDQISREALIYWLGFVSQIRNVPLYILVKEISQEQLVDRIVRSEKHLNQCRGIPIIDYVRQHYNATEEIELAMRNLGIQFISCRSDVHETNIIEQILDTELRLKKLNSIDM